MYRVRCPTVKGHATQISSNPTDLRLIVELDDRGDFDALRRQSGTQSSCDHVGTISPYFRDCTSLDRIATMSVHL